jgi:hypothetical protein
MLPAAHARDGLAGGLFRHRSLRRIQGLQAITRSAARRRHGDTGLLLDALAARICEDRRGGPAPIAHGALERIGALYAIENRIRGRCADERRAIRQTETRPLVEALKTWLENRLIAVLDKSTIAEVIRYGFNHWHGLVRFLDDGRIEMDTNSVERAMRTAFLPATIRGRSTGRVLLR